MGYRAWTRAGTALLVAATPSFSAFAQGTPPANPVSVSLPATSPTIVPVLNPAAQAALQKAIANNQRIEPSRDRWRNPTATLQFFGVRPGDTVIEVWPGQGWYTSILGPYLKQGGGSLVVGHFDAVSTNSSVVRQMVDAYRARFAADPGTYGAVSVVPFGPRSGALGAPGSADSVLTFRNVHNWMRQGWAEKAFGDFFLVLKPGGILGIEEHRGRTDEPQDPLAVDGYVREDFVIQLAREAGFDFIGRSEINANPADTKDHPFGVWTLPPVSRTSALGERDDPGFDRTRYNAIGESDRMTLRFRKPLSATGAPPAAGTRWSPVVVMPAPPTPVAPPRSTLPVVRPAIIRPAIVTPPVVKPAVVTPPVVVPSVVPSPVVAPPLPPIVRPPSGPSISSGTINNSEAAAPRSIEPVPVVKPPIAPIQSPPPATLPPATLPPAQLPATSAVITPPTVEAKPLAPIVAPVAAPVVVPTEPVVTSILPAASTPVTTPEVISPAPNPTVALPKPIRVDPEVVAPNTVTPVTPIVPAVTLPTPAPTLPTAPQVVPIVKPTPPVRSPVRPSVRPPVSAPAKPAARPAAVRPAPPPPAARPVAQPTVRPAVRPTIRPAAPAPAIPARPVTRPTPKAAPVVRPSPARPTVAPPPKAKAKALPSPNPRPATRPSPPPIPKKKAAPPPSDTSKPDWIVPRRRS